jgi:hypothetical protein
MDTQRSLLEHRVEILRDDIRWLESRIQQLQHSNGARAYTLTDCYRKLLHQRQQQLVSRQGPRASCPGCWHDYLH